MLKDFDIAFTNKIRSWFSNTIYANTALVYNVAYNLVDDASLVLKFPLVSIYKPNGFSLVNNQNFAAKRQGIEYYYNEENGENSLARYLVANLPYQIDIYAKTPEALADITEDIMHALNLDPTLTVSQYDPETKQNFTERYDIVYLNGASEQSEFQNDDRIYHAAVAYEVSNARLLNFKKGKTITDIDIVINEEDEDEEES